MHECVQNSVYKRNVYRNNNNNKKIIVYVRMVSANVAICFCHVCSGVAGVLLLLLCMFTQREQWVYDPNEERNSSKFIATGEIFDWKMQIGRCQIMNFVRATTSTSHGILYSIQNVYTVFRLYDTSYLCDTFTLSLFKIYSIRTWNWRRKFSCIFVRRK